MICEKCGAEIPEDSVFCSSCGNKIIVSKIGKEISEEVGTGFFVAPDLDSDNMEKPHTEKSGDSDKDSISDIDYPEMMRDSIDTEKIKDFNKGYDTKSAGGTTEHDSEINSENKENVQDEFRDLKSGRVLHKLADLTERSVDLNKKQTKLIALIAVGIAAIVVACFGIKIFSSGNSSKGTYICTSDGSYELITDLNSGDSIALDTSPFDSNITTYYYNYRYLDNYIKFSKDGKYIYYLRDVNDYDNGATLYRIENNKLSADSDRNEKYKELIATGVSRYELLRDGKVVYSTVDGDLYFYDGEVSKWLTDDVYHFRASEESEKILLETSDSEEWYCIDPDNRKNDKMIDSSGNHYILYADFDSEYVIYADFAPYLQKVTECNECYLTKFDGETEKISDTAYFWTPIEEKVYCVVENSNHISLYDIMSDQFADKDNNAVDYDEDFYRREKLREALQEYSLETWTMYCFSDGKKTVIAKNILCSRNDNFNNIETNNIAYCALDNIKNIPDVDDYDESFSASDILIDLLYKNDAVLLTKDGKKLNLSGENGGINNLGDDIYCSDSFVCAITDDNKLMIAKIKNEKVGEFTAVSEAVEAGKFIYASEDTVYFLANGNESTGDSEGIIYACTDGKIEVVSAYNESEDTLRAFQDGSFAVYDRSASELNISFGNNRITHINGCISMDDADGYKKFWKIGDSILYISDEDLYVNNENRSKQIRSNVDYIWVNDSEKVNYI